MALQFPNRPTLGDLIQEILSELERAQERFGPFQSAHEGHAILREEFDELWDSIKAMKWDHWSMFDADYVKMRREAVQVAAMAIRFLYDVCPVNPKPQPTLDDLDEKYATEQYENNAAADLPPYVDEFLDHPETGERRERPF